MTLSWLVSERFSHGFDKHAAAHGNIDSILTCACDFFHTLA